MRQFHHFTVWDLPQPDLGASHGSVRCGNPYLCFQFAPKGWAFCNGQILPLSQNTALFSLLGTTYGGDGKSNFALPNMQGNVPMNFGQ